MALTRLQIRTNVENFTGKKNKTTEINSLCDLALREAMLRHSFRGARGITTLSLISNDYFKLLDATNNDDALSDIVALRIKDSSDNETVLELKNAIWFAKNVGDPSLQSVGRPCYCYRKDAGTLIFDRPCDVVYTLTVEYSDVTPVFADDTTVCPIACLDIFVVFYCCASIYLAIADEKNYSYWMQKAVGTNMEDWQGGAFQAAVRADEKDSGKEVTKMDGLENVVSKPSVYISDLDNGGVTKAWYRR